MAAEEKAAPDEPAILRIGDHEGNSDPESNAPSGDSDSKGLIAGAARYDAIAVDSNGHSRAVQIGDTVTLTGLRQQHMDGRVGVVTGWNPLQQRWVVRLKPSAGHKQQGDIRVRVIASRPPLTEAKSDGQCA